jgi:hypothetical protein
MWLSPCHDFIILILKLTIVATDNPNKKKADSNRICKQKRKKRRQSVNKRTGKSTGKKGSK